MSSRLLTGFKVEVNTKEDYANIEVLQTSNFPPSAFNDSATRAMLSWLLIDSNAKLHLSRFLGTFTPRTS